MFSLSVVHLRDRVVRIAEQRSWLLIIPFPAAFIGPYQHLSYERMWAIHLKTPFPDSVLSSQALCDILLSPVPMEVG